MIYFKSIDSKIDFCFTFSKENISFFVDRFKKLVNAETNCFFNQLEFNQNEAFVHTFIIYKEGQYPFNLIGPVEIIWDAKNLHLYLWSHISIFQDVNQQLVNLIQDTSIKIENWSKKLERFRLLGEKSIAVVAKAFADKTENFPSSFKLNVATIFDPNVIFLLNNKSMGSVNVGCKSIMIIGKQFGERQSLDIIVPTYSAKELWYRLVRNRSHLVGGLRDAQVLALDVSHLHFNHFGFPDFKDESEQLISLNWKEISLDLSEGCFVIRDKTLIDTLKTQFSVKVLDDLIANQVDLKNGLVIVELICKNRGAPEKGDIVCLPTKDDVERFLKKDKLDLRLEDLGYGPQEVKKLKDLKSTHDSSRKVIGFVEFGGYSLDIGLGKAMAAISFLSLKELVQVYQEELIGLIRSQKSTQFRFVKIIIDHFSVF